MKQAGKIELAIQLVKNMGWRYIRFRIGHEWRRRTGSLARKFPTNPPLVSLPTLESWRSKQIKWVWQSKEEIKIHKRPSDLLANNASDILSGKIVLFNTFNHTFSKPEDWITNPETGVIYDTGKHWSQIQDLDEEAGDIKYVWEKSRFTYLQTIIRYDYHFDKDHANWVFSEMESWISQNPINCGPNYVCSQELSLRIFNWIGALTFYQNSSWLTDERWNLFMHHIYWQMHHVRQNIDFSRIAVRNNHAITETLALYIAGTLFPEMPGSAEWKKRGKDWFEEEIGYQIYADGGFLQFSMNYHRVVIQLLTLAIRFAEVHKERFHDQVYNKASASLHFLRSVQDPVSGQLPNYGANDGALFFQFTDKPYRVYTDQLNALGAALFKTFIFNIADSENSDWFGYATQSYVAQSDHVPDDIQLFTKSGFAAIKEIRTLTFLRSGRHKDRPSQADNLHLDIWQDGKNLLRDAGTYKYNTTKEDIRFFFGTRSHNALMVNGEDQMLKGPRFIWLYWSQAVGLVSNVTEDHWEIEGNVKVFKQLGRNIMHRRKVTKARHIPVWTIEDSVSGLKNDMVELLWHPSAYCLEHFDITVVDGKGRTIQPETEMGWYSSHYAKKEEAPFLVFKSISSKFTTTIRPKDQA